MDASEYWLLRYAVHQPEPTDALLADDFDEWFNLPHHGLNEPDLVELLWQLFRRGDFIVGYDHRRILTKPQIKASLSQNPTMIAQHSFYYGLSA